MKATLFLTSALLTSLSAAAPLNKRSYVWKTVTQEVFTTVEITSTVWVDAVTPAAVVPQSTAVTTPGAFYEQPKPSSSATPAYTPSSSPSNTPANTPSSSSSVQPVASTPAYTPPAPSSTPVYTPPPVPSTTQTPTPVSTPAYTPSSSTPPASTPTSGSPGGTKYYGDITYYNPAGSYGSCGWTIADSDPVVALAHGMMGEKSNGNSWCGKKIEIVHNGKTFPATIGDKCMGCEGASIDLTVGLWNIAAPDVDGRGHNVEWYVVD